MLFVIVCKCTHDPLVDYVEASTASVEDWKSAETTKPYLREIYEQITMSNRYENVGL